MEKSYIYIYTEICEHFIYRDHVCFSLIVSTSQSNPWIILRPLIALDGILDQDLSFKPTKFNRLVVLVVDNAVDWYCLLAKTNKVHRIQFFCRKMHTSFISWLHNKDHSRNISAVTAPVCNNNNKQNEHSYTSYTCHGLNWLRHIRFFF